MKVAAVGVVTGRSILSILEVGLTGFADGRMWGLRETEDDDSEGLVQAN